MELRPRSPPKDEDEDPFHLTIRFTSFASLQPDDMELSITQPSQTRVNQLKQTIRSHLPSELSKKRLRLVYNGKILQDASILSSILKRPAPPPPKDKKGKAPEPPPPRIYINCSLGEDLSESELEAEKQSALEAAKSSATEEKKPIAHPARESLGFDRLLQTGFTQEEVNALRSQFLAIQSRNHTPDTMPPLAELRRMEEAWLDDNGTGADGMRADDAAAAQDDFLWGTILGVFWPLGAMGWMAREEGVWSERRRMNIYLGVFFAAALGIMRVAGT